MGHVHGSLRKRRRCPAKKTKAASKTERCRAQSHALAPARLPSSRPPTSRWPRRGRRTTTNLVAADERTRRRCGPPLLARELSHCWLVEVHHSLLVDSVVQVTGLYIQTRRLNRRQQNCFGQSQLAGERSTRFPAPNIRPHKTISSIVPSNSGLVCFLGARLWESQQ
jgi:hypothetical protein